jgi:E3 ubiquitin-protein ligase RNF1/2
MERVPGLLNCPIVHISVLQFQLYLVLLPVDGQTIPHLEKPYLSCQPTLSIQHLVEVIAFLMDRLLEF